MNKQKIQLLLIVAAFLLPAMTAILLQTRWFHWEPTATKNRGELIRPVIALGEAAQPLLNGHHWLVLLRMPSSCDEACQQRVSLLSRVREAQGKEMDRVKMVAWSNTAVAEPWTPWQPSVELAERLAVAEGGVLLIDPLGNAMLRFGAQADPTDVRKDVAHLLRWSKVGK